MKYPIRTPRRVVALASVAALAVAGLVATTTSNAVATFPLSVTPSATTVAAGATTSITVTADDGALPGSSSWTRLTGQWVEQIPAIAEDGTAIAGRAPVNGCFDPRFLDSFGFNDPDFDLAGLHPARQEQRPGFNRLGYFPALWHPGVGEVAQSRAAEGWGDETWTPENVGTATEILAQEDNTLAVYEGWDGATRAECESVIVRDAGTSGDTAYQVTAAFAPVDADGCATAIAIQTFSLEPGKSVLTEPVVAPQAGDYRWTVSYSANAGSVTDAQDCEEGVLITATANTVRLAGAVTGEPNTATAFTATVSVTGAPADLAGTGTAHVYGPFASAADARCAGVPAASATFTANGNSTVALSPITLTEPGVYVVQANLDDTTGLTVDAACEPATAAFTVTRPHVTDPTTPTAPGGQTTTPTPPGAPGGEPATPQTPVDTTPVDETPWATDDVYDADDDQGDGTGRKLPTIPTGHTGQATHA